jgi:hypothetical protein
MMKAVNPAAKTTSAIKLLLGATWVPGMTAA